jgi:UDP-N-acetylmuramate dehydrogenase
MSLASAFPDCTRTREPIAPYTHLKIGGPAEFFVQPRSVAELAAVLQYTTANRVPVRMLGGGFNLLVRDDPIPGAVVRLVGPEFAEVQIAGTTVRASGGGGLFDLIAATTRAGLAGLETLVGIRGTVGGSVRCNVGDRSGEIAGSVRRVAVLTENGTEHIRTRDELNFSDHHSDLDEPVIVWVEFGLDAEKPAAILKRMRRAWIRRKATEPGSHQNAVRMFRNPAGQSAAAVIDRAGLAKFRTGQAEISERNSNYVVAHPGTTAADILGLMATVSEKAKLATGVTLEPELHVW